MTEFGNQQLKHAVESQHGGTATFVQAVPVNEIFRDRPSWHGVVHIFDLTGGPSGATRAYAWSSPMDENSAKRRFFAVLHTGSITGPVEAVRAAIVAEARAGK